MTPKDLPLPPREHSRREFLRNASLGIAGVAAGATITVMPTPTAQAAEPDKKLGFALCGLGSLSTNQIAPALQKTRNCRLAGIITGTPAKAEKWKAQYKKHLQGSLQSCPSYSSDLSQGNAGNACALSRIHRFCSTRICPANASAG